MKNAHGNQYTGNMSEITGLDVQIAKIKADIPVEHRVLLFALCVMTSPELNAQQ